MAENEPRLSSNACNWHAPRAAARPLLADSTGFDVFAVRQSLATPGSPSVERTLLGKSRRRPYARDLRQRPIGIDFGNDIEQALQIAERLDAYFDACHERARGRRGFLPATLSVK